MPDPALSRFSEPTRRWFEGAFAEPTAAQAQGWTTIAEGSHTLICAPTGSGKTLAAFLWALDRLFRTAAAVDATARCRVLYVSPLKALAYDVQRNLRAPLAGIANEASRLGVELPDVRVASRTGDTPAKERREIGRSPPDILVTTPESLYLLLTSQSQSILAHVETVIVDEVHAVAGTKRGTHLALSLERLDHLVSRAGRPAPDRVGLSATQRPLSEIGRFLAGRERDRATGEWRFRPVELVDAGVKKELDLEVIVPVEDMGELGRRPSADDEDFTMIGAAAGDPAVRHSIWPSVHPVLLDLIQKHRSTLVFVNSRSAAERLAGALNDLARESGVIAEDGPDLVRAHHGSLAREQRVEIEEALKAGRLPALVATSSLELGIDMGAIDLVVQVEAPPSVASGMQRIGRAGHQVGEPSKGRIFPKYRGDLVVAAVAAARMQTGEIEHTRVPRNPLDVLAQQVVAMAAAREPGSISVDDVAKMVGGAYSYTDLTREALEGVLDMLSGRYPSDEFAELRPRLTWDRVDGTLTTRAGARLTAVMSGGTIPDRGHFTVVTPEGGKVGELDEEMVYESRSGETIRLGATSWRIENIDRDRVVVLPAPGEPGKLPFWKGDGLGRPLELGKAVGGFLREVDSWSDEELAERCGLDALAITNLRRYVAEEKEATGGYVPTDEQIVVERFKDELGDWRVCMLSPFGTPVHAPWALAVEARIRERLGLEAQAIWTDDGIVVRLPEADDAPPADTFLVDPDEVEDVVTDAVGSSALFASRFRENAARALLLPRKRAGQRTPLWQQRQRAADLLRVASQFGSFPVLLETYRECLRDVFDLPGLVGLLRDVQARRLRVVQVDTPIASPFASSIAFRYVADLYDQGDIPLAERRAQALTLDRRMLAELVGSDELRELLDPTALVELELELQALDDRRRARSVDAAHNLLLRLGDLSEEELAVRSEETGAPWHDELIQSRRAVIVRIAGEPRLIAVEDAGRYRDALGSALPPGLPDAFLEPVPDALTQLVRRWARTHGPFTTDEPARRFGLAVELVAPVLVSLEKTGTLVYGAFRPGGAVDQREWCDSEVLTRLRQRSLAALRKEVEPTDQAALARFVPAWHGIGSKAAGLDRVYEVVTQLQGCPIPASVLERDVMADRVEGYSPRWLDELVMSGEVLWVGTGPLGRDDGRVALLLRASAPLLLPRVTSADGERPSGDVHDHIRSVLADRGACFFRDLGGSDDRMTLDALWDLVWAGEVTNDGFAALRAFLAGGGAKVAPARSRRSGRPRLGSLTALGPPSAAGRWSLVRPGSDPGVNPTEAAHQLAAVLLERHGVLTREAVRGEGVSGGFAAVYPVLRAMEEAGRIRRGYFVSGLGGAQFAVPGAVDRLRAERDAAGREPRVTLLAATDPAQPYGLSLSWPKIDGARLARVAGAYLLMVEGEPALFVERGARTILLLRDADGSWELAAAEAVAGLVDSGRYRKLTVETWPNELADAFVSAGFTRTPKGLTRYPAH